MYIDLNTFILLHIYLLFLYWAGESSSIHFQTLYPECWNQAFTFSPVTAADASYSATIGSSACCV